MNDLHSFRIAAALACLAGSAAAATNLVHNGDFDAAPDPLDGWTRLYDKPGESWYAQNHLYVAATNDGPSRHSLRLTVPTKAVADNWGVKVDSRAIAVDPRRNYRFSVQARSTGPKARIMLEGYRLRPSARPEWLPDREDLRLAYRYPMIYFQSGDAGGMAVVPAQWTRRAIDIPGKGLTDLARQNHSKVQFMVVHIVAIGTIGDLFVDDIRLEPVP
jgi:hypothetical protein